MPNYRLIRGSAFFPRARALAIADLHLGYDAELRSKGAFVPTHEFSFLHVFFSELLAEVKPKTIIVNGDFKHSFGRISQTEWKQTRLLLELLTSHGEVVLVAGNHDAMLGPLADMHGLTVASHYVCEDTLFLHGDKLPTKEQQVLLSAVSRIIIGHEHPAVGISDGVRTEKIKCYLVGEWKDKQLLVLPSVFSLTEGTDILQSRLLSPFLQHIEDFSVIGIADGELLPFGKVEDLL